MAEGEHPSAPAPPEDKAPKTERGRRTRDRLLQAAGDEFGERGYHEASISGITNRAGVALGTFYVYFESKEAVFRALVTHTNRLTRAWIAERVKNAPNRLAAERLGLAAFVEFIRAHKTIYRIVMESQFVAPDAYEDYYRTFAEAYQRNLETAAQRGEITPGHDEARAWALIGISVFVGLKFGVWEDDRPLAEVVEAIGALLERGMGP